MRNKIYVVRSMYLPNSAVINRMRGHLLAFSQAGYDTEAVFISPNHHGDVEKDEVKGVTYNYCWGRSRIRNKLLVSLFSYFWAWRFVKRLPHGNIVLLLGASEYLFLFTKRKDIRVFYETTEHPSLFLNKRQIRQHIKQCQKLKHIFVISRPLRSFFLEKGIPEEKISIINMTVDPQRFNGIVKQKVKKRYVAYCGTVTNNKDGVDDLLRAFAITHITHPDVLLYIIGAIPDPSDRAGNMHLIDELRIKESVVFTGVVPSCQMPQLLMNASVLALDRPDSIQARNGFPTKLGEYLLTGNPVVVTKVGDIPYFLKDGVSALLSNDRNANEFAQKLIWALDNEECSKRIGNAGREVALKHFDCITEGIKLLTQITTIMCPRNESGD